MKIEQSLIIFSLLALGVSPLSAQTPAASTPQAVAVEDKDQIGGEEENEAPIEATSAPAPERSLLKTAASGTFNKPLYFDQIDNGVILPPMELEYDLSGEGGKELKLGNVTLKESSFFFALAPLGKAHSQLSQVLSSSEAEKVTLLMMWPTGLLSSGTVEMISRTGDVLWRHTFTEKDRLEWQTKLTGWRKSLVAKGVDAKKLQNSGFFGSRLGLIDIASYKAPFWNQKESFRFCLTQTVGLSSTKICSQRYGTKSSGNSVLMGKVRADVPTPRVLVNNEEVPLKNTIPVSLETPTSFFAELGSGESYEFVTLPNKMNLMDISDLKNPTLLKIVGFGTLPTGRSVLLNQDQSGYFTKLFGFESTIGDTRKFWAATIKKDNPHIYLPGQGGGVFKQRFELSEIPRAQSRIYLHKRTPTGTYIDGIKLEGRKQPVSTVATDQNAVTVDAKDPAIFEWQFRATERGKINRSYLNVEFEGKNYRSYYEIFKGYPRELSGRFTGVASSGDLIVMGEVAYNQWFEDLFGWTNYWASRQRWGVSAKYFQSFNQLKVDTAGTAASISVVTVDLKYRATPGLWGRDESVGPILTYQNVTFDKMKAPMLGVGAFWARSMPRVFDDLFNYLPFMRYPKWVDMEFLYYASSMDSNVTLNSPMSLNFHGKVLWTERIFGEAGFGLKRYGFSDSTLNQKAELNTFYGTVGLGINF